MSAQTPATPPGAEPDGDVLLRVENLVKHFPVQSGKLFGRNRDKVHAVDGVSLEVRRGETLGLVGETGCGKSTFARCVTRLHDVTSGRVLYDGHELTSLSARQMRPFRREIQMIFQDPHAALNPAMTIEQSVGDPLKIHGRAKGREAIRRQVAAALGRFGLVAPEPYLQQ